MKTWKERESISFEDSHTTGTLRARTRSTVSSERVDELKRRLILASGTVYKPPALNIETTTSVAELRKSVVIPLASPVEVEKKRFSFGLKSSKKEDKEKQKEKKKEDKERKKEEKARKKDKKSKEFVIAKNPGSPNLSDQVSSALNITEATPPTLNSSNPITTEPATKIVPKYTSQDELLTHLPHEVIHRMLGYLTDPALVALSQTCKDWKQIIEDATVWCGQTLREYIEKLYKEEQKSFYLYPTSPEYEHDRVYSVIRMMAYLTKLHKKDLFTSKLNMLCDLHLSLGNYIEAGLTTLLYADEYSWNDTGAVFSSAVLSPINPRNSKDLNISIEPGRITKERLYHKAIKYFNEGKYWELGIALLTEMRNLGVAQLHSQAENLELEHEYYLNIRSKDRFFEQYFMVDFFGGFGSESFYNKNKSFIYRGVESERLGNFITKLKTRFPKAEILHENPTNDMINSNKQYLRVRSVKPSSIEETRGQQKEFPMDMPSPIKMFNRCTNLNIFSFSNTFRKSLEKTNEFRDLWVRNTFLFTKDIFPTIHKCSPVLNKVEIEISPIETSIKCLKDKTDELNTAIERAEVTKEWKSSFTMSLKGVIDAAVNGGVQKYKEAFFTTEFLKVASDEEKNLLPKLQEQLEVQVKVLEKGLAVHSKTCPENMLKLQEQLESQFAKMKVDTFRIQEQRPMPLHSDSRSKSFIAQRQLLEEQQELQDSEEEGQIDI